VNELVQKARQSFRQAKGISQDHYVLVVAPGETSKEIKFTFRKSIPGLKEFLSSPQIKSINKDFFEVFVILPEDDQAVYEIKAEAAKLPNNLKVHFIDPSERYGALSAADFGILHNGEITVEAAACQLPATVLDSMNDARAYIEYLFNGHCSPLNVSTNFHGYEELLGGLSVTPAKLAYILNEHFVRPKLRYYYAKLYREHIQIMLSRSGQNPNLDVSQTGLQVASKTIIDVANKYKLMDHNVRKTTNERKDALSLEHH
jgi:lipid A disaccharide synthetase